MSDREILSRAARLAARGEPFALATVVRREAPSSARPGWRALVEADGTLHGWLGGSCIEPTVRREALEVLRDGRARFLVFAPEGEGDEGEEGEEGRAPDRPRGRALDRLRGEAPDLIVYPMVCHSGGTVEIFLEPQIPAPVLALYGDSPVSRALAVMAPAAGWAVRAVGMGEASGDAPGSGDPPAGRGRELYAVVATMGEWDEDAVRQALDAGARYVGLVASPRRAEAVWRALGGAGVRKERLERLVSPAGLDLGAEEPGEIAVTILAELVERRRRADVKPEAERETTSREPDATSAVERLRADWEFPPPDRDPPRVEDVESDAARVEDVENDAARVEGGLATDPVCGMAVEVEDARHVYVHQGETYHFCCPHCRERFAREPERYLADTRPT